MGGAALVGRKEWEAGKNPWTRAITDPAAAFAVFILPRSCGRPGARPLPGTHAWTPRAHTGTPAGTMGTRTRAPPRGTPRAPRAGYLDAGQGTHAAAGRGRKHTAHAGRRARVQGRCPRRRLPARPRPPRPRRGPAPPHPPKPAAAAAGPVFAPRPAPAVARWTRGSPDGAGPGAPPQLRPPARGPRRLAAPRTAPARAPRPHRLSAR